MTIYNDNMRGEGVTARDGKVLRTFFLRERVTVGQEIKEANLRWMVNRLEPGTRQARDGNIERGWWVECSEVLTPN